MVVISAVLEAIVSFALAVVIGKTRYHKKNPVN